MATRNRKMMASTYGAKLATRLDLPCDAILDNSHIELLGSQEMNIEGHKGVLCYDETLIKLSMGAKILEISGRGLVMKNLTSEGVSVFGEITKVEFI